MGLAVAAFLLLAVGPHVFGYRTMTMLTGSMAPEIEPGDVTVVTPIDVTDVTEGMVITYHQPIDDHALVTHRVVSVDKTLEGTVTIQTKGDANEANDPWTATLDGDTAYQVQAVIPELGHLIQALRTPVVDPGPHLRRPHPAGRLDPADHLAPHPRRRGGHRHDHHPTHPRADRPGGRRAVRQRRRTPRPPTPTPPR